MIARHVPSKPYIGFRSSVFLRFLIVRRSEQAAPLLIATGPCSSQALRSQGRNFTLTPAGPSTLHQNHKHPPRAPFTGDLGQAALLGFVGERWTDRQPL